MMIKFIAFLLSLMNMFFLINISEAKDNEKIIVKGDNKVRIALCHLEVSCGPLEKNVEKIAKALRIAGEQKANVAVTPETSVQGYYFHKIDAEQKVDCQPASYLDNIRDIVMEHKMYLLLGCGEYDPEKACSYNSCLVFNPEGKLQSSHRKIFNEKMSAEAWATPWDKVSVTEIDGVKVGVLVCADSWFDERPLSLKEQGAKIIIDCAAWPETKETGNPVPSWEKVGKITGLPFVLCNQTGKTPWMDMSIGESVVVENGSAKFKYSGKEAVLIFEWNSETGEIVSDGFEIYEI